jgi:CubicO group peptidase (beta-lactamase class C family)
MKSFINIFLVLFLFSPCLTGLSCSAGQNRNEESSKKFDDQSDELSKIVYKAKKISFLKSLIVMRNDKVIVEEYLNGGRPDQLNDIRSASKSILSGILGCAIRDGHIDSIDQKIIDFFPEYKSDKLDPRIYDLRIRHLITMRSGFDVRESGKVYEQLYESNNWIEHILNLPFKSDPGKKFNYHSFNTHLLSGTITKASGMSTLQYATQALFAPLGITKVLWEKDPNGYCIGGWGLSMTARDMVKFGSLYLKNGIYRGTQIIPSEWIKSSTTENTGMIGTYYSGWNNAYGYGYLWWVRRLDDKIDIPYAMGHGGQRIVFIPNANAVLVTQAEPNPKPPTSSYKRHRAIDSLLFDNFSYFLLNSLDPSNKKSDFFLRPTLHPFG